MRGRGRGKKNTGREDAISTADFQRPGLFVLHSLRGGALQLEKLGEISLSFFFLRKFGSLYREDRYSIDLETSRDLFIVAKENTINNVKYEVGSKQVEGILSIEKDNESDKIS